MKELHSSTLQASLYNEFFALFVRYILTTQAQFIKEYISSPKTGITFDELMQCALQHLHFHHLQQLQQPSTHRSLLSSLVLFQSEHNLSKAELRQNHKAESKAMGRKEGDC